MDFLYLQIVSGLASGGIYACLAVGLVLIYRATGEINFAQGEMATLSAYCCWALTVAGVGLLAAIACTLVISFAFGVLVYRMVVARYSKASHFAVVIVYLALFLVFNSVSGAIFGFVVKPFPSPFTGLDSLVPMVSGHVIGTLLTTFALMIAAFLLFRYTKVGLAMRAAAISPVSSRLLGIDVEMMRTVGWGLAATVSGMSAILAAPMLYLDPMMMVGVLIYAFAGALLGGINSPVGAAVGAAVVGVTENLMGAYVVGTEVKMTVALAIIIGALVFKPDGIFGQRQVLRA